METLAQEVFEGSTEIGFFVAVFDDDGSVEGNTPGFCVGMAFAFGDGAGAGDDDSIGRDDEGRLGGRADDGAIDEIEDGGAAREDGAGGEYGAGANDGAFVDSAVAADEDVIFDDDRAGVDGLEDSADLCGGTQVDAFADLRARADQGVRVDHGAFIDPGAGVDVHRRHADDTARDVSSGANGGAAGNDAHAASAALNWWTG